MAVRVDLVRPDDLLNLQIDGVNLKITNDHLKQPVLVVEDPKKPAYLIVTFPPQTIAEGAYFEASIVPAADQGSSRPDPDAGNTTHEPLDLPGQLDKTGPGNPNGVPPRHTNAELGHPSRLVFAVPPDAHISYTLAGLLDWSGLQLNVNPIAAIGPNPTSDQIAHAPAIQPPADTETSIELPYRLVISPNRETAWLHRSLPFTSKGRTELWHTRLALKPSGDQDATELSHDQTAPLRAIWSPDYNPQHIPPPTEMDPDLARTAMAPNDRHQIVILTSAFHGYEVEEELSLQVAASPMAVSSARSNLFTSLAARRAIPFQWTVPYVPQPFNAEQLMLSSLGGYLRSRGHWTPPHTAAPSKIGKIEIGKVFKPVQITTLTHPEVASPSKVNPTKINLDVNLASEAFIPRSMMPPQDTKYQLDLSEWVHIASQGRDHYVRIVYEGELWPFRHKAALIKVTERKFMENGGIVGAYLMQRMFIVVRQPVKTFAVDDRANPLKRVQLTTLVTPDIASPQTIGTTYRSFWVEVMTGAASRDLFKFHALGTDVGDNCIDFTIPLMFVSISDIADSDKMKQVADEYNAKTNIARRGLTVPGQKVMFAEPDPAPAKNNTNTQLVTQTLNYIVNAAGDPPQMLKAEVKIPQVQELLGTDQPTTINFFQDYVSNGIDAVTGVFAQVVKEDLSQFTSDNPLAAMIPDTLGLDFSADKAGGFATPNMGISTLTRALGPLAGDINDAVACTFDPTKFFKAGMAMLFGTFDLIELLFGNSLDQNAPKMTTTSQDIPDGKLVITKLDWEPGIKDVDLGIAKFQKQGTSKLSIHGTIQKAVTLSAPLSGEAKADLTGTLTNFNVSILSCVQINFVDFSFTSKSGQKPDVKVNLDPAKPVQFGGDLQFVEELRKAIPPGLFGDGPSLDLAPTGIRAGFAFGLPPLSVAVFALKDVNLAAALELPFLDGKPALDFNISERQHPFQLAVAFFAGGGYFHLGLDTAGIKDLEAALEFGAAASIDIGVASGEVHMMAGIYFSLQRKEGSTDLTAVLSGYLRMGGSLSILGLIKLSLEFNLSFTYDSGRDKAYGRATLTVEVEVLFFSKSIELTVERAFGGSGDPKFVDLFDQPAMWSDYAGAFA